MDFIDSPIYMSIASFLMRDYPTAANVMEADVFLESAEIYEKVKNAFPGNYFVEDVELLLIENNYQKASVGSDLKYVWLFKKNNDA